jgi:hypothetical protein
MTLACGRAWRSRVGESPVFAESDQTGAFRRCAASHGLRLHRIHVPAGARAGLQATVVFDCSCGLRWLMRVDGGGVVPADHGMLAELKQGRAGMATAPPGFPGAQDDGGSAAS